MGNFRSGNKRSFGGNRGGSGRGRSFGGQGSFGGSRGRSFGSREFGGRGRESSGQMYDAVCDKCKRECQVPFKPRGDKPVLCSDCFSKKGDSRDRINGSTQSSISKDQFSSLNAKLDKIIAILEKLEIIEDEEELDEISEDSSDDDSDGEAESEDDEELDEDEKDKN